MQNVTKPRTVSFEEALRNLASKLTSTPTIKLPRTQEAIVQYMAENVPTVDEMVEAIVQEVIARLAQTTPAGATDDGPSAVEGKTKNGKSRKN